MTERLMTPYDAASYLSVSRRTLDAWRYRGNGPDYVRISARCIRYRSSDLKEFADTRLTSSTAEASVRGEAR